jgi:hypothetical protein
MLRVSEGKSVPFQRKVIESALPSSQVGVIQTEKHSWNPLRTSKSGSKFFKIFKACSRLFDRFSGIKFSFNATFSYK